MHLVDQLLREAGLLWQAVVILLHPAVDAACSRTSAWCVGVGGAAILFFSQPTVLVPLRAAWPMTLALMPAPV